jgi:hypothetical protein
MLITSSEIHSRIGSAWPDVLAQLGLGDLRIRKAGPCPVCGGVDRFTFDNRKGRGDFICRSCGAGDGFELLMNMHGWTFSQARLEVMRTAGIKDDAAPSQRAAIAAEMLPALKEEARKRQESGKGPDGSGGRGNMKNLTRYSASNSVTQLYDYRGIRMMADDCVPAVIPAPGATASLAEPVDTPTALRPKVENFAQAFASHGNAARAYREAFDCSPGIRPGTVKQRAYELVHSPAVAARVRALLAKAAEGTTISARARMAHLQTILEADPAELVHVVREPCKDCWSADALVAAQARSETPDTGNPREDCAACRGDGTRRVLVTPTAELSLAARRLLKGIRQKPTGEIEIRLHDQLSAADMLNRMTGSYAPDRSVSVSASVSVDFARMTRDQQLDFLDSLRPAR